MNNLCKSGCACNANATLFPEGYFATYSLNNITENVEIFYT